MKTKDLYIVTPSLQALTNDLKSLSEDFVTTDEDDNEILKTHSRHWAIDYIGLMVREPAVMNEEGEVTTEATYWEDGDRANMRLVGEDIIRMFKNLKDEGVLDDMEHGSRFVNPSNPQRKFA